MLNFPLNFCLKITSVFSRASVGEPKPALGVDIGDGVLIRYDEKKQELTGITLTGIRQKLLTSLK